MKVNGKKLPKGPKQLFDQAWDNQEGMCLFSDRLLKKNKVLFGVFYPPQDLKDKFDNMDIIPYLVHEDYRLKDLKETYKRVEDFFFDLFEVEKPEPKKPEMISVGSNDTSTCSSGNENLLSTSSGDFNAVENLNLKIPRV